MVYNLSGSIERALPGWVPVVVVWSFLSPWKHHLCE